MHISVHQPIILFTSDNLPLTRANNITIRTNTYDRKDHFKQCFHIKHVFHQLDTNIYIPDLNHNYEILEHSLKETDFECFPERRVRFNDKKKHRKSLWITNGILRFINTKNKLYKKLKKTKIEPPPPPITLQRKQNITNMKIHFKKTIPNAKRVYYKEIFNLYIYTI